MTSTDPSSLGVRSSWWVWLCYWLAMFTATHLPHAPDMTLGVRQGDKLLHFLAYFGLTLLGGWRLRIAGATATGAVLVRWALIYAVYAAVDEGLQHLVGRSPSLGDWLADVLAVAIATLLLWPWPSRA